MAVRTPQAVGVLGRDASVAGVIDAARSRGWRVLEASDRADDGPDAVSWTALLDPRNCDAVVVGGDGWNAARADAVRTLVQAGRLLVLGQPLDRSMLWAFELDMIARDSGARLLPALPDRLHPWIGALVTMVEAAAGGAGTPLESIRLERVMADRSRDAVLAALSRDVDIVRVLAGDPTRVTALGAGDPDAAWATLAVGLTAPNQVPARWQVAAGSRPGLRVALHRADGSQEVFMPDGPDGWTSSPALPPPGPFDRGAAILDRVTAVASGATPEPTGVRPASWIDAARALEIAEAVPRSLARGRAIDLHREEFSELGTFKGTMASLGCGIVLLALVLAVLATLVAGVAVELDWDLGKSVTAAWPAVILAAMVGFLALQVLPFVVGPDRPPAGPGRDDAG